MTKSSPVRPKIDGSVVGSAGAPAGRREQEGRCAVPDVADLTVGLPVAADVLLAEERAIDHEQTCRRTRSGLAA